jgi:glycosyltransferase involved in cell wall biosynthesis
MGARSGNPSVSVIIPAYNAARFLPRCLKSVFAQTLKPYEVIVINDGSTDNTATLAEELGARVITQTNGGIASARNLGIQKTSGEWIAMLDADDMWAPEKLERQIALIRPDTVLVYTGIRIFDDQGIRGERLAVDPAVARKMLRYRNPITPSSVLMQRKAFDSAGGFRKGLNTCEDWGLWFRLMPQGQFEAVSDPLTDYYVYHQSASTNPEKMLQGADVVIDGTLTANLRGFERWAWKRRIHADQLCSAALIARDNGLKDELHYISLSLRTWPSPFWQPRRFAIFAVSVRNALQRKRKNDEPHNGPGNLD